MIREIREDDFDESRNLIFACLEKSIAYPREVLGYFREEFMSPDYFTLRSTNGGIYVFEDNKIKAIGCVDADWVRKVFVSPESQRQGIGTNMLAYVEKQIRANGFDRSWAYSYPSSLDFALNRGYEIVERLTFKDEGLEIPGIKMTKQLI